MTIKLSVCIPTLNRGAYIGHTLQSIVSQLRDEVEIVIVDGGSTDNTAQIVADYQRIFKSIRFVRKEASPKQPSNEGFARDCNSAVEFAAGEYCWLMTDDDLLIPGAIRKVLDECEKNYALIVASAQVRDKDLDKVIVNKRPALTQDRIFRPADLDQFAVLVGGCLSFVASVIIKRQLWLGRNREKYMGSAFIHVGVIFDEFPKSDFLVFADPLVLVRHGNAHWTTRTFQIWMFNWPELIWSFNTISEETKNILAPKERWRNLKALLLMRALGTYSIREYQSFLRDMLPSKRERILANVIALAPRVLLRIPAYIYLWLGGKDKSVALYDLRHSPLNG